MLNIGLEGHIVYLCTLSCDPILKEYDIWGTLYGKILALPIPRSLLETILYQPEISELLHDAR